MTGIAIISTGENSTMTLRYDVGELVKLGSDTIVLKLRYVSIDGLAINNKISKLFIPYHRVIWWSN